MRGKDDAAGMPGPVRNIQSGIKLSKKRIAAIAEYGLNKVQITEQITGCEEAYFQIFFEPMWQHFYIEDPIRFNQIIAPVGFGKEFNSLLNDFGLWKYDKF